MKILPFTYTEFDIYVEFRAYKVYRKKQPHLMCITYAYPVVQYCVTHEV